MSATLWEPDDVTTFSSVWMAGLQNQSVAGGEEAVFSVRLVEDGGTFNGSSNNTWTGTILSEASYATYTAPNVVISNPGVYAVTVVSRFLVSNFHYSSYNSLFQITVAPDGATAVYPYTRLLHNENIGALSLIAGNYFDAVSYTDVFTLVVSDAPETFNPSVLASADGYGTDTTYTCELTVSVKRLGSVAV